MVSNATLGAVGHVGSLGCQGGGMVGAPLQRVHPEQGCQQNSRKGLKLITLVTKTILEDGFFIRILPLQFPFSSPSPLFTTFCYT